MVNFKTLVSAKNHIFTVYLLFVACKCNAKGSTNGECDDSGTCGPCKKNVEGKKCEKCKNGYKTFPDCNKCIDGHWMMPVLGKKECRGFCSIFLFLWEDNQFLIL